MRNARQGLLISEESAILVQIHYGVGVSVGVDVGIGVSVGVDVGIRVSVGGILVTVGVTGGTVGVGRLRLSVTRLSTCVLSPIKVKRNVMIPFGLFVKFHE